MRKTKIICTLGPATEKTEALRQLIQKGADVFRLNMSHATHEWVREIVPRIRRLAQSAGRPVAILLDTQGPAIRTGDLETALHLKPGDILEFTVRGAKSKEQYSVDVNYPGFVKDVAVGNKILVDNGLIKLVVLETGKDRVRTRVLTPAVLGSRRHINLPGVHVNLPPLTKKDIADVALGTELGVDFVALSFVREKSDIEQLRQLLSRKKSKAQIVAKIEDQLAVRSIDKMIESADVIMVARGDLGIECPMEELPIIQRHRVATRIERSGGAGYAKDALLENIRQKTVASAVALANSLEDSKLIVFTLHGRMARYTSNLRPQRAPIFAFTPSEQVYRQLALYWGTFPVRIDFTRDPDKTIASAEKFLCGKKLAAPGNRMVIISDVRMGRAMIDSIQLRVVK